MGAMSWDECVMLIRSDVHRLDGRHGWGALARAWFRPASRMQMIQRVGHWSLQDPRRLPVRVVASLLYRRWSPRYGFDVPFRTRIGPGLKILHLAGGVVVNPTTVIGANCNLNGGVLLGGKRGVETVCVLGDFATVSAGAKVIASTVGERAVVGANAVVTKDVPAGRIAVGIPARLLGEDKVPGEVTHPWIYMERM